MDVYGVNGHTAEELDRWGSHAMRSAFQQATFDFMDLQGLDHASMFCCDHLEVSVRKGVCLQALPHA